MGVGPAEGSDPVFFAFSVPQGLPGGMVGASRVSVMNPGIRTPGEGSRTGEWLARRPLTWRFVIDRRANGGFLSPLLDLYELKPVSFRILEVDNSPIATIRCLRKDRIRHKRDTLGGERLMGLA